ncbi:MAG: ISAzo13 family transposase, partial [Gloeobacteraceae cyanobacterium ES-bin-144]|nr:ISAzo13 family transposase [Verrucomicrobiales bacterium]
MEVNIAPTTRQIWQLTLDQLDGQARRLFMASVVTGIGRGGAAWAKRELGWDRTTVRKGLHELESGVVCFDDVGLRGRKGFAARLPQLQDDLRAIGEASGQTDPTFRATQLYRRLTAAEAKRQLLEKGYSEQDIPSERRLCRMLGKL